MERLIVKLLVERHHEYDTTLREISRSLGAPYSTVRRAVRRLEDEGVVRVLRLSREYLVRIKDAEKAWELGYLDEGYLTYGAGYLAPITAYKGQHYLSDEVYITLPFRIKRHPYLDTLIDLELKSRAAMSKIMNYIGEWPRFTALFYRTTLQPADDHFVEWAQHNGLTPTKWSPPAYGFFAFLLYVVRELTGLGPREAYCKALELMGKWIQETRSGDSPTERFVDEVLREMSAWPCTS
ncbi:MAG: winged helix-turn-helix transcriptional regulator [Pyrobaculum sp.]